MNPTSTVRSLIYLLSVFINACTAFLVASGVVLNIWLLAIVAGFNAVVAVMARANVTPEQ